MIYIDISDISQNPRAFGAHKLPIPVSVVFESANGQLMTREGLVDFSEGDAILTGVEGESWPITRQKFKETYQAIPPTEAGKDGVYIKAPSTVACLKIDHVLEIQLSSNRGILRAEPGDYLVQYQLGDLGVVGESIFLKSYKKSESSKND